MKSPNQKSKQEQVTKEGERRIMDMVNFLLVSNAAQKEYFIRQVLDKVINYIKEAKMAERKAVIEKIRGFINENQSCGACNFDIDVKEYLDSLLTTDTKKNNE